MQPTKLLLGGLSSLIGLFGFAIYGAPENFVSLSVATANSPSVANLNQPAKTLPKPRETQVLEHLRTRLGLPQSSTSTLQVTEVEPATWRDCLPNAQGEIPLNQPCEAVERSGWRVKVAAQGQTWLHYVTTDGFITLDAPESISQRVRSQLAKRLSVQPADLRITAAELVTVMQACPINAICAPGYTLSWRVLANGRFFHVDMQGQDFPRGFVFSNSRAGLSGNLQTQILRDAVDRHGGMAANLRIESIKAITWSWCGGGSVERPTPPEMGACLDIKQSGWQVIVRSGPLRYIYYPTRQAGAVAPVPDGWQSLPRAAFMRVQRVAMQEVNTTVQVYRAEPAFFDRCLNLNPQSLSCRQGVQAGWWVVTFGGGPLQDGASTARYYHTDLLGDRAQFVASGRWTSPPTSLPLR
jgi:hypothetical protein